MRWNLSSLLLRGMAVACLASSGSGAWATCGPETRLAPTAEYSLVFKICGDSFHGTITAQASGWVAMGFSRDQYMPQTDVYMAGVLADGTPYGSDAFATFRSPPTIDNHQDVTLLGASEVDDVTTVNFSRPLKTGDDADYDLTDGPYHILMAFHADSDSLTRRHSYADVADGVFFFAPVPEAPTLLMLGGGLGLLAARRLRPTH